MTKVKKSLVIVFSIVIGISIVIIVALAVNIFLRNRQSAVDSTLNSQALNLWEIYKIQPAEGNFDISIKSSSGTIRNYEDIFAFGLAPTGNYLAYYKQKELHVDDLKNNTSVKFDIGLENIFLNAGESINWSYNDRYFVSTIIDRSENKSLVLIGDTSTAKVILISANIPYNDSKIETVYFSPIREEIVVRTYELDDLNYPKPDGALPSVYEIPAYLSVFDPTGNNLGSVNISDYQTSKIIYYGFDVKGRVKYMISDNELKDFIVDEKYTKLSI